MARIVDFVPAKTHGLLISYDDAESLKIKSEDVNKHGLGGVMVWELSADDANSTLLTTIHGILRPKKPAK